MTKDHTVGYRWRDKSHIFPLKFVDWEGTQVSIPQASHVVSEKEFGGWSAEPGSYMTPLVFRGDCFHNFFNGRWLY